MVTVPAPAADNALMATQRDDEDAGFAEEITARALSEIQLAYAEAIELLAVISHDWEKSAAQTLEPRPASPSEWKPASPSERSAVTVPVASQAA